MPTAIKICGIDREEALEAAIAAGASHAGLVFVAASPRQVALPLAARIAARAAGRIALVGLFVDAGDRDIAEAAAAARLDAVQLHGGEDPARAAAVAAATGLPVWKALPVRSEGDIAAADAWREAAAMVLFDAAPPASSATTGGTGLRFDWNLLAARLPALPWGLAGGLDAGNVAEALRITGAPLVDVSSGVEGERGVKDVDRIRAFAYAVRSYDHR